MRSTAPEPSDRCPCASTRCSPTASAAPWWDPAATSRSCAHRSWHDDAVFSSLLGGARRVRRHPADARFVWGGHYEPDSLIWRSRWVVDRPPSSSAARRSRSPATRDRVVLLRRVEATRGDAHVARRARLPRRVRRPADDACAAARTASGHGRTGDLPTAGPAPPTHAQLRGRRGSCSTSWCPPASHHDLVLEISAARSTDEPPDPDRAWDRTERRGARRRARPGALRGPRRRPATPTPSCAA